MRSFAKVLCLSFLLCFSAFAGSRAGWIENGIPLTVQNVATGNAVIVSDGSSGAILAYGVCINGVCNIGVQRVDAGGNGLWGEKGEVLCPTTGSQYDPQITADGSGGAIVTWQDSRSGSSDIYAQRVDGSGTVLWQTEGIPLCTATGNQEYPQIAADGLGGAIVMWRDDRSGSYDIYVQRVDGSGTVLWQTDGIPLCAATGNQEYPQIAADGLGGAIVTWRDYRSGSYDIYAQRVDGSGAVQWQIDGVLLCTATGTQLDPQIISDGSGGAIVAWEDNRSDSYSDIYAQRVDGSGTVQWQTDGVPLCLATGSQYSQQIIPDGSGGAIVTWHDYRSGSYDIYTQRVNGSGAVQWQIDGVPLCTATRNQLYPQITPDDSGGAIVTWDDYRSGTNHDIYTQRVDGSGTIQWQTDGVPLCTATGNQLDPQIVSDGAGGAIVTWYDYRSGNFDIYAQRADGSGTVQWQTDGVLLFMATENQGGPQITFDGSGGAIVTWWEYRSGSYDVYAQRVDGSGAVLWQPDGVLICAATGSQYSPQIISDGSGGAIVTWQESRSGTWDIYAQRVDGSGTAQWQTDGVPLCTATGNQYDPQIASDGSGGAIVTWDDYRSGTNYDIYTQRVNGSGAVEWQTDGVPLCTATGYQYDQRITSDSSGGAIVTWRDRRSGDWDIYAQRVDGPGAVRWQTDGVPLCTATGSQLYPQITTDNSGGAIITWYDYRSGSDSDVYARRVNSSGAVQWQADGVPLCTATGSQSSPQITSDGSGGAIVTWYDNRSGTSYDTYTQRVNGSGVVQWQTDGVPLCTATENQYDPRITSDGSGGAIVTWRDYRSGANYDIYAQRVDYSGAGQWQVDGVPLCTATGDQEYPQITTDGSGGAIVAWPDERCGAPHIYAARVSGSGEIVTTLEITVPGLPLTLYQNIPNPFNANTVIRFYLPEADDIVLDIYNVAGQLVVRIAEGRWQEGLQQVMWDGRNGWGAECSTGVYFMRLRADKGTISRKMVLLR